MDTRNKKVNWMWPASSCTPVIHSPAYLPVTESFIGFVCAKASNWYHQNRASHDESLSFFQHFKFVIVLPDIPRGSYFNLSPGSGHYSFLKPVFMVLIWPTQFRFYTVCLQTVERNFPGFKKKQGRLRWNIRHSCICSPLEGQEQESHPFTRRRRLLETDPDLRALGRSVAQLFVFHIFFLRLNLAFIQCFPGFSQKHSSFLC